MPNSLLDFLKNEISEENQKGLFEYKNSSCQSGGHISFINYLTEEMSMQHIRPSHKSLQQFTNTQPTFFTNGRLGGLYCKACMEVVNLPTTIENAGYYGFSLIEGDNLSELIETNAIVQSPWMDMIKIGQVILDDYNNALIKSNQKYYDAWVIPDNIGLQINAFKNNDKLIAVSLPSTLKTLETGCFENCLSLQRIEYRGTINQWNQILKNKNWNALTGNYTIYCIDGKISKTSVFNWYDFISATHSYSNNSHIFNVSIDTIEKYPLLMINSRFTETYRYGDTITITVNGVPYLTEVKTNTGDELLNDCFIKDTVGNFYLEINQNNNNNINKIIAYFIPSYSLMIETAEAIENIQNKLRS